MRFQRIALPVLHLAVAACAAGVPGTPEIRRELASSSSQTLVYDDALAANWQDWSWSTHDLGNLSPVSAGARSISVDFTPYGGLSFFLPAGVPTTGAATLEFDVNGGTAANQAIAAVGQITTSGAWGPEVNIAPYCAGGAIPAGAFTHCRVPLTALQVANTTFQRIALKEVAGLTLPRMYFDQIAVVPAPSGQTLVYDDALAANWQDRSWSTHDLGNLSPVSAGARSISVDFTPWAGLSFYLPAGVSTTGPANLEFDVNGGTAANQAIAAVAQVILNGAWGPEVNIAPYCAGGAIPAGAFTHCRVPLGVLQVAGTTFQRIAFKEVAGLTLPRMYFDQIAVVPAVATPIAVSVAPHASSATAGGTVPFTATVTGTTAGQSAAVGWSVQEIDGGTVSPAGVYTAPGTAGTYHVVATSVADSSKSDVATVTVTLPPAIAVSVSPHAVSVTAGGTVPFAAAVTGTTPGQSAAVNWSVQEIGGGIASPAGVYTAPATAGTYHVVATSVADPSKNDAATVTVLPLPIPLPIAVSVSPNVASAQPGGTVTFTATVTGIGSGQSTAVTWSVQELGGGTVDSSGRYTAPATVGTYHVGATSVADASKIGTASIEVTSSSIIPADRLTTWNPGVLGGVPARTSLCATVNASAFGNGASDATAGIQAAINGCPAGQVVQLSAGTFTINGGNYLLINKGITLRGAGPDQTTLQKTDGAKPNTEAVGPNPSPLIIVGPARWSSNGTTTSVTGSTNLTADAVKDAYSITVASTAGFGVGQNVLLDELSGASWQVDPAGRGQIWASPDFRVVWQLHNPAQGTDDPLIATTPTSGGAASWFCRQDRPTSEVKEIASIGGNTITFSTPIHISYRVSHAAQLSFYGYAFTKNAGVESLKLIGGDNGQLRFQWCSQCWATSVENTVWHDEGFAIEDSFRVEIRDSYVHDAAWAQPGGAGYAISLSAGSAEALIENNISFKANKVMVARSAGAGSVFGYNYVDDGYINTNTTWIEVGLNASHMVGPHHVLFEGNYGFNWDSDKTHGSAIYHTIFRNHLRGVRRDFNDTGTSTNGPRRCAGAAFYSYWHSFVGNVLGAPGQMSGWVYQSGNMGTPAIWLLGWDDWNPYPIDPQVALTTYRHGNFDYVTNSVIWDPSVPNHALPPSLYLSQKPAFFNAGIGYVWPWVDPTATPPLRGALPAKARFDAGTPFVQP